jgi:hypothetical protein
MGEFAHDGDVVQGGVANLNDSKNCCALYYF